VSTKGQLFQFNGALYEQTDGVAMGSSLRPLLANVFMSSLEEKLELEGKLPDYYRRYVDDTLTVTPNITTATDFLNTLNHAHPSVSFTMEIEKDGMLPFLGTQLLNRAAQIETKVCMKPTNTGLLVHYQSHVDNRYKWSLLTTMLNHAYRLSSSWPYFSEECERLKSLFSRLDYPHHLINSTINAFVNSRVADQQPLQASGKLAGNDVARVVIPFKDQDSANIVKIQLKDLSIKLQTTVQPVFVGQKIGQDLQECETKPQLVNQQCVVYQFKCNLRDTGNYVSYTRWHLYTHIDGHKSTSSSVHKHYDNDHAGAVPEDLLSCFKVLKKCMNKFNCLVNEMLYIKQLTPSLNVQTDSIRAKVLV